MSAHYPSVSCVPMVSRHWLQGGVTGAGDGACGRAAATCDLQVGGARCSRCPGKVSQCTHRLSGMHFDVHGVRCECSHSRR
jgi:hypothetical protein